MGGGVLWKALLLCKIKGVPLQGSIFVHLAMEEVHPSLQQGQS